MKYYLKIDELENIFCYDIYELKEEPFWDKQIEITKELFELLRRDKQVWFYEDPYALAAPTVLHRDDRISYYFGRWEDYRKFIPNFNEYFKATTHLILYDEEIIQPEQITLLCKLDEYDDYDCIMERLSNIRKHHNPNNIYNDEVSKYIITHNLNQE